MAVATGTALLAAGALSAGANMVGAKKGADASKDAARIQSQSADRAMGVMRDVYGQQMGMVRPYVDAGTQSLAAMMQRYGNAGTAMPGHQPGPAYVPMGPGGVRPPQVGPHPNLGAGQQTMGSLASMRQPQPQGGGSQVVMMQSPDGDVRPVPAHMVAQVEARGGRRMQ